MGFANKLKLFLSLIIFLQIHIVYAQENPIDSISDIDQQATELLKIVSQQKEDSLKRIELESRFLKEDIKNTTEYKELYRQIEILKNRDSLLQVRRIQKIDSLKTLNKGHAVQPFDSALFYIYNNIGSFSAKERAESIENHLRTLTEDWKFDPDSLTISEEDNSLAIRWKDRIIMTVNDNDAIWMNSDKTSLTNRYLETIQKNIKSYREKNSLKNLLKHIAQAILILFILGLIIHGLNKLFKLIKSKILFDNRKNFKGVYIKNYELVSAPQIIRVVWTAIKFTKWFIILVCIYLALPLLFNLFPATEGYAPILIDYFIRPIRKIGLTIIENIPNFITIFVILVISKYTLKLLKYFAVEIDSGSLKINGFYREWAKPTFQILKVLLLAFTLIVIFPYLPGSDSPIFQGVSVFIGVLFTFGSTGAISNIVAGLVLTYMRSFSVGDSIKIGDVMGDVTEKSLLVTRIRTNKNEIISIPNSQVMNSHTINFSIDDLGDGLIVHAKLEIGYEVPWQKVHELAIKAALDTPLIEKNPSPFVFQSSLDSYYVSYQINAYTKHPNKQAYIYSELYKRILDIFHEANIELISPTFNGWRDASELQMPPKKTF